LYRYAKQHAGGAQGYIALNATDPQGQGKGLCSLLMRTINKAADALDEGRGVPCYLECSGARNVEVYRRYGGAVQVVEST
jgi:hypothetical protein